jgi:iron-sulfur cluster repair protein YtfE (RIC family)
MLTQLGAPRAPHDVVDLLLECHERIRSFTALAGRLAAGVALPREEVADAATRVRRYFAEALPLHARDEEDSISPRLRGREAEVDRELAAMEREHADHGELLVRLITTCDALAREPERQPELAPGLRATAEALARHFEAHLEREERVLFPAIRRLLPADEQERIVDELRRRRG